MNCKEAAEAIARALFEALPPQASKDLEIHLKGCWRCSDRLKTALGIRRVIGDLTPMDVPEEVIDGLSERIRESLAGPPGLDRPPAVPHPEKSLGRKLAIVVGSLAAVLLVMAILMFVSGRTGSPRAEIGTVACAVGTAEFQTPGMTKWARVRPGDPVLTGTGLRAEGGGMLRATVGDAEWWLDEYCTVTFTDERTVELLDGRVYVEVRSEAQGPIHLNSREGALRCGKGSFTVEVKRKHLLVGCIAGDAYVEHEGRRLDLPAGSYAMLVEGEPVGPVRRAHPEQLKHWLRRYDLDSGDGPLTLRQVGSMPVAQATSALPNSVVLDVLKVDVVTRGAIALVHGWATVRNTGESPWSGELSIGDLLLPGALAEAGDGPISLDAGATTEREFAALCLMRPRSNVYSLAVAPQAWTEKTVGRLDINVDADADGGLRMVSCPNYQLRQRGRDRLLWSHTGQDADASPPILLEFRFDRTSGADTMSLLTPDGGHAVACWRPPVGNGAWFSRGSLLLAFDATAFQRSEDRVYAHEFVATLFRYLPFMLGTTLLAHDGAVHMEPTGIQPHNPSRTAAMLIGLWKLEPEAEAGGDGFLKTAVGIAGGAKEKCMVVFVTGPDFDPETAGAEEAIQDEDVRVIVVRLGAPEPGLWTAVQDGERRVVVMDFTRRMAGWAAALDVFRVLEWSVLADVRVQASAPATAAIVPSTLSFSTQPMLALVSGVSADTGCTGTFRALCGEDEEERAFEVPSGSEPDLEGKLAQDLVSALGRAPRRVASPAPVR